MSDIINKAAKECYGRDKFSAPRPTISRNTMKLVRLRRLAHRAVRTSKEGNWKTIRIMKAKLPSEVEQFAVPSDPWFAEAHHLAEVASLPSCKVPITAFRMAVNCFLSASFPLQQASLAADRDLFFADQAFQLQ